MFANTFLVTLLAAAATGLPGPVVEPRQGTGFRGRCILSTNSCNVTDPVGATGIMLNCAAGGGFNGQIGAGQNNCTVDGHYCEWFGLFGAVFCNDNAPSCRLNGGICPQV